MHWRKNESGAKVNQGNGTDKGNSLLINGYPMVQKKEFSAAAKAFGGQKWYMVLVRQGLH